jgi:large conductance mechanosensitive channel
MKKFLQDFKAFIRRGNVLDLAVGIIIGGAFNTIVRSLVNDVIMPIIGLVGGKNISEAKLVLVPAVFNDSGEIIENAVTLNYGAFIQSIIDFLIIAFTIFLIIRVVGSFHRRMEALKRKRATIEENQAPKPTTEDLLMEIRDLLKKEETA